MIKKFFSWLGNAALNQMLEVNEALQGDNDRLGVEIIKLKDQQEALVFTNERLAVDLEEHYSKWINSTVWTHNTTTNIAQVAKVGQLFAVEYESGWVAILRYTARTSRSSYTERFEFIDSGKEAKGVPVRWMLLPEIK